jgi:kynureninase
MTFQNTLEYARKADALDPLKYFRERFFFPQHRRKDCIYFTGNSLGLQPRSVSDHIDEELENWASLAVEGHFKGANPWVQYHDQFPGPLSKIVGALPEEIVVMNTLTVNLHMLMGTFYRPTPERFRIICEAKAFPSDQYALESQVQLHGFSPDQAIIEVGAREGEYNIRTEDILATIDQYRDSTALVLFGGINYYSGQVLDMEAITQAAHKAGAYAGFDLAHAAGNVELHLHDWQVDFACWCSYKYLNSGPGGVSGAFIHEKHARNTDMPRLAGWWGYEKETRLQMKPGFKPIPTAEGWQVSNAPILLLAAHKASLDIFEEAGMQALLEKSRALTSYLFYILDDINAEQSQKVIEVITPRGDKEHGAQVSMLMHRKGREIFDTLIRSGVIGDWREPNVIRVAPVPLYNTYEDVWQFGHIVRTILSEA